MIVLDTHVWVWWVHGARELPASHAEAIAEQSVGGVGVSAISCWEVAKLVERSRLDLPCDVGEWLGKALSYPHTCLLPLTPEIAVESTRLPGAFHRDPADQIIVATARLLDCLLVTADSKLRAYSHVETV